MRVLLLIGLLLCSAGQAMGAPAKIVAFGTSLTARGDWQGELASQMAECAEVELVTIAQSGANSDWAVANLPKVRAAEPAVVLIEFSVNDASLLHGLSHERSRANTETILDAIAAGGARAVLMTMNPAHGARFLSRPWLADYYQLYREIAEKRGVALIDLTPLWDARGEFGSTIPDGIHPTAEAARAVVAPAIAGALRPLLCP